MAATDKGLKAKNYSITGSFNPGIFAFYQATAAAVESRFASREGGAAAFRRFAPVLQQRSQGYLGTISNYMTEKDYDKAVKDGKKSPFNPNPGERDGAWLNMDTDTLIVSGTIKMVANFFKPCSSDNAQATEWHTMFVKQYMESGEFPGLIRRYLANLVNAHVLWRNQYGFDRKAVITVKTARLSQDFYLTAAEGPDFDALVSMVAATLEKQKGFLLLDVALCVELGAGSEVFPSQPFLSDKASVRKENYGRVLSAVELDKKRHQVIFHPQKIGNALRQIDVWYAGGDEECEPIAIEAYGVVASQRVCHRPGATNSYYKLAGKSYAELAEGDRHYLMGMFIKGGLLGQSE